MSCVTDVACHDSNFAITFADGSVLNLSAEEFASRLSTKVSSLDIQLDAVQMEAVLALAVRTGETIDEFVESAVVEKLLRDR